MLVTKVETIVDYVQQVFPFSRFFFKFSCFVLSVAYPPGSTAAILPPVPSGPSYVGYPSGFPTGM